MNALNGEQGRREFLQRATRGAVSAAAFTGIASGAVPKDKKIELADTIPTRLFGKTDVELPILGYGGAALPKVWGNPLSTEDRVELVRYTYDQGLRYYDTGGNYMESQAILGEALQDLRDNVFLVSKVETTNPAEVRRAVEESLSEMKTDYLDAILIHGTPGIEQMSVERAMEIHGELIKLREEGITRFIGLSAHSYFDKVLALISSGGFDQCMLAYGYIPRGYNQIFSARMLELRNACVAKAHELGMGIVAMKVMGAGILGGWAGHIVPDFDEERIGQLPGAAIRYVLQDERIHMLCIGMRLKKDINANIKILHGDTSYTQEDRALLAEFSVKAYESDPLRKFRIE